jgi:hypothetical protein
MHTVPLLPLDPLRIAAVPDMPRRSSGRVRQGFMSLVCVATLAACGGPDSGKGSVSGSGASGASGGTTTFLAYAQANPVPTGSPVTLSTQERAEVASRSRQWAAEALITRDAQFPTNAVVLPPLHFGRVLSVGAAASGTTLAELQGVVPAPSSPAVAAGLMRGLSRLISSGEATVVSALFMDAVSAKGYPDTWASLTLSPLSAGELLAVPNLRLAVGDVYATSLAWPQVVAFGGVFEAEGGTRGLAPMLRITGPIRSAVDATMSAVALELPQGRHLVRITPNGALSGWSADALVQAIATVTSTITGAGAAAAVTGDLVLPDLSVEDPPVYGVARGNDFRGMGEAMDMVHANLRGMDGLGGNYVELNGVSASMTINAGGMTINGSAMSRFIFSPLNLNGPGFFNVTITQGGGGGGILGECGTPDLRPSYLAVINALGGVEMLARLATAGTSSSLCYDSGWFGLAAPPPAHAW